MNLPIGLFFFGHFAYNLVVTNIVIISMIAVV